MANTSRNQFGQPVGAPIGDWTPPPRPPWATLEGRYCRVEPQEAGRHGADLFEAFALDPERRNWTYRLEDGFASRDELQQWLEVSSGRDDPMFFAFIDLATGKAVGNGAYMRIAPAAGSIEVGSLMFSPLMQRTRVATEAMFLMMRQAFALGYRRYEWKCDALNEPSRRAAQRLGFSYEGTFRQAMTYKGRNRDTAWFACIDADWPRLEQAYETWLAPGNFDEQGKQKQSLASLISPILVKRDGG